MIKRLVYILLLILGVIGCFLMTIFAIVLIIPEWIVTNKVTYTVDLAEKYYKYYVDNVVNKIF